MPLKSTIVTQACSGLDLLAQLTGHSVIQNNTNSTKQTGLHQLTEEEMKQITITLLRWLNFPQLEIVFSTVNIIGHMVNEEKITSTSQPFPIGIIMLLTNGLFNRIMSPSAYTFGLEKEKLNWTKALNVKKSTTMLIDCCVNAIIDLHASDDLQFHNLFIKLQGINKCKQIYQQLQQHYHDSSSVMEDDDRDKVEETIMNISNFVEYKEKGF